MLWQLKPEYHKVTWSESRRRAVGDQLGQIGNWLAIGWRLFLERMFAITKRSTTVWRTIGNRSAIDRRSVCDWNYAEIVCNHCDWSETSRQTVADQTPTSFRPPKTFLWSIWSQSGFSSKQNILAPKSSLRHPCDSCNLSATSRRPHCYPSATSLRPPEIMAAWRSPTVCKVCVAGAWVNCIHWYFLQSIEPSYGFRCLKRVVYTGADTDLI